ncbi:MAG: Crp/Fnr family transcriptional regulator [Candidatus Nanopelagicales bacterium]|nr:Crp/Fnr family transcriptional regulator [Candidatus Nanopelagicales bacterium]
MGTDTHANGAKGWTLPDKVWRLAEVDIFRDLGMAEVEGIAASTQMKDVLAGTLLISPNETNEVLFILKAGRVRLYRLAADGRSLTTAIIEPGQIFGQMLPMGQQLDDTYAEALEPSLVCIMSRSDVNERLLSDPRVAARVAEVLGARVLELERRLGDTVLMSVPARIASALATLARDNGGEVRLTHEQLADLVGTTRETTTKVLGDLRQRGLVRLRRGRIQVVDVTLLVQLSRDEDLTPVTGGLRAGRER